jgi:signal transduction histidine kinase
MVMSAAPLAASERPLSRLRAAYLSASRPVLGLPPADVVLAIGLIAVFEEPGFNPYRHSSGFWWAAAGAASAGALAWRRLRPWRVWAVTTVAGAWLLATRWGLDWGALSPLVVVPAPLAALYTVTGRGTRRQSLLALAGSAIALLGSLQSASHRPEDLLVVATMLGGAWALGDSSRTRREVIAALRERATALEAERAERDRRAASEERTRIARELHDVLAHHISIVALQAGTARLLAESGHPPDAALLAGIETTSRQAMTELRQALGVIRHSPAARDGAAPRPGTDRLPELISRMAQAGLAVTLEGEPGPLAGRLDLAAYRIVQEGLTNVVRHSAARTARVTLRREASHLRIAVADAGPARGRAAKPAAGGGNGLSGVAERAASCGGWARAAALPGGGFQLEAQLPLGPPRPAAPGGPAAAGTAAVGAA